MSWKCKWKKWKCKMKLYWKLIDLIIYVHVVNLLQETIQTYHNVARACLIDNFSDLIMLSLNKPKLNEIEKLHNRIRNKRVIIVNSE